MAVQKLENVQAKPPKPEKAKPNVVTDLADGPVPEGLVPVSLKQERIVNIPGRDFYADHEAGDITAGFVASHGTWQKWVSNIQTPDGRRGIHETKLVPCTCDLCTDAIKKKGWTF